MTRPLVIVLAAACPFPSPQGSQVFVGQMAEAMARRGHEVHLVTYGQDGGQGRDQERQHDGQKAGRGYVHHRLARIPGDDSRRSGPNPAKPILDAMLAARLVRVARAHRADVIHAHNYEAAMAGLVARAITGVPVLYHSHNLMGDELETYFEGALARRLAARAGALLDRQVPRRADSVIALCEWSAGRLVEAGCERGRLAVIPPAVEDEGPLGPDPAFRRLHGIGEGDFVVGYSGNLDAYQNLPLLVEAFARLVAGAGEGPRPRLLVASHRVGDAAARRFHDAGLGEALVVVEVEGRREARRAEAASDVVALPRRLGSGYPVKLLNSMSAARPVVTAGCGSKVLVDGVDGVVVADDDAAAMAGALEALRLDPGRRRALGEAARRRYLEIGTWERVLPRVEGVVAGLREPGTRGARGR